MNSIRTPKEGTTVLSKRIARAVDNLEWQEYRLLMKGRLTIVKLQMLMAYFESTPHATHWFGEPKHNPSFDVEYCDICCRVDNYLKALARGGQLEAGVSLAKAHEAGFINLRILK